MDTDLGGVFFIYWLNSSPLYLTGNKKFFEKCSNRSLNFIISKVFLGGKARKSQKKMEKLKYSRIGPLLSVRLCGWYLDYTKLNLYQEYIISFSIGCRTNREITGNPENLKVDFVCKTALWVLHDYYSDRTIIK